MEIEPSPSPVVAKKLWNIVRIVFIMLRKGIAKSKIMVEFHLFLKRSKLAASKAMATTLTLHHHYAAAFKCRRSHNAAISASDYEFSCSNSPAFPFHAMKRKHHHNHRHGHGNHPFGWFSKPCRHDDVSTVSAVQKVLEMLNNNSNGGGGGEVVVEGYSPLVALPGFGKSPIGRQLRITDSPFPLKDEGDSQVDVAAEEFIKRFYKDLNLQQKMESPYHNLWDR